MNNYRLLENSDIIFKVHNHKWRDRLILIIKILSAIILPAIVPFTVAYFNFELWSSNFWEAIATIYAVEMVLVCIYVIVGSCCRNLD